MIRTSTLLDSMLGPVLSPAPTIPMSASRADDDLMLAFDLPGVQPADVKVAVVGRELTVSASRTDLPGTVLRSETFSGSLKRTVVVAPHWDTASADASFGEGRLFIRVPLAQASKPREIEIAIRTQELDASSGSDVVEVG